MLLLSSRKLYYLLLSSKSRRPKHVSMIRPYYFGTQLFKLEDVAMGIWIEQFRNGGKEVEYLSDERFYNAGCESNYVLAHYQNPRKVLCLWEKLQKDHQPACCE